MPDLKPFYENVRSHYDVSDEFFALFLDRSLTYSCAYFERDDMTLEQAQWAKVDLALGKCDLQPGMTLLDVGCGWGSTMLRAIAKYDVNVIGLTLSRNQYAYVERICSTLSGARTASVRLQGWEEFDEPVDRIVSIGAFEHFRQRRYPAFFQRCHDILPEDGRMLLHTIIGYQRATLEKRGIPVTREHLLFAIFMLRNIFPGGQLPEPDWVTDPAQDTGFRVERIQSLQPHYARTLDCWAAALSERRDDAVRIASQETYDGYMKYLTGCADLFRTRYLDVMQFTLTK
ncbi:cyclopropane mycolic acid synthase family methyltransferase [Antrihabitans cavernicola]|uniref:Methyltransferase domain-containing protein n=1 Tax=Antrihabitans cavernicola TaxID=2495913 RepID=A0A5A7S399_9NOCA|nr:cyclopropane mycolic acid synthase family methyltransferase [Spelaeibacter cavernicola]KAA0017005.1 methyltransferase domain-containing protein [Spelaeibacter cavernicola]